jgi:vacuolar-type H+-ATPase subunit H
MDIVARLQQLEEIVREAKSMPLSSSALVNREETLELLREAQESLPEEIKQARWVVKDREELLAKARGESELIVEQAREDQLRMARKEEIVRKAAEEAEKVLSEADASARALRREAEDYADGKLAQFETALRRILEESQGAVRALSKTMDQVELGRQRLRAPGTAAEQEFAEKADLFDDETE